MFFFLITTVTYSVSYYKEAEMIFYGPYCKKIIQKYGSVIELCTDEDKMRMIRNRVSDCI